MNICAIVMAASEDERMQTDHTKVMLKAAGKPVVAWVKRALDEAGVTDQAYVVGYRQEHVRALLGEDVIFVLQERPLGTGHAVMQAESFLEGRDGACVIVAGDAPLLRAETVRSLVETFARDKPAALLLTALTDEPQGYGRIVRDEGGQIERIVEEGAAGASELGIGEVNAGIYCFSIIKLRQALAQLKAKHVDSMYLLTDVIEILRGQGERVATAPVATEEIQSVNTRQELEWASRALSRRAIARLMAQGVSIVNPEQTLVECDVEVGRDTLILPNCALRGHTVIGAHCTIGPDVRTKSATIGDRSSVDQTRLDHAHVGADCQIGPFVVLSHATTVGDGAHIDRFVELDGCAIGDQVTIGSHVTLIRTTVGRGSAIGPRVVVTDTPTAGATTIGDHVALGAGVIVHGSLSVGSHAEIEPGVVLTESVAPSTVASTTARVELDENKLRRPR